MLGNASCIVVKTHLKPKHISTKTKAFNDQDKNQCYHNLDEITTHPNQKTKPKTQTNQNQYT